MPVCFERGYPAYGYGCGVPSYGYGYYAPRRVYYAPERARRIIIRPHTRFRTQPTAKNPFLSPLAQYSKHLGWRSTRLLNGRDAPTAKGAVERSEVTGRTACSQDSFA